MELFLHLSIIIPFLGFFVSLFVAQKNEKLISRSAVITAAVHLMNTLVLIAIWLLHADSSINVKDVVLFKTLGYEYFIDFYFDKISAVYLLVGSTLMFLITIYSRYYLHREQGYKRFFNTTLFFYLGYNVTILSGNLETLFIGWEILGISSFLLIAFYRDRYLPVKNAVKVFSIYRIGDVGIILAMWLSHHLWHENITFDRLTNYEVVNAHLQTHSLIGVFISVMILISACAKSAQLPFSSWLPRAMEGPTPSTAIFYGSLSVHIGVFILLRTFPFWEHQTSVRILIGFIGLVTSIVATGIARVQSSVKSQVAYASISQIGIIFIEVAAGFETLALFHIAGNAFLRTYQLLVSPSVVAYLIREQFYNFVPRKHTIEDSLPKRLEYSFYLLCLKEWNLDSLMYQYLWNPLKAVGRKLNFLTVGSALTIFFILYPTGLALLLMEEVIPPHIHFMLPVIFAFIGVVMVFKSFSERWDVKLSWTLVLMNHFWIALAVSFNEHYDFNETILYLSGITVCGIVGFICVMKIQNRESDISLDRFHGHVQKHPVVGFIFLLACLGISGFPITPTFIGEDLIFSHIHEDQLLLAFFVSLSLIVDALSVMRIYARLFMGPHMQAKDGVAFRSS